MHVLLELIETVAGLGIHLVIGAVMVVAVLVTGAVVRSRAPRAGTALALAGLALPVLVLSGWLLRRGMFEMEMAGQGEARKVHVMKLYRGARPEPGWVAVKGIARYELGAQMKMGSVLFGTLASTVCYPVTPPTRMRQAPLVACSRGREPGGTAADVVLEGVLGVRPVPDGVLAMFEERTDVEIAGDALRLDEGVPPPSRTRGGVLMAAGVALALAFVLLVAAVLRRRPATD